MAVKYFKDLLQHLCRIQFKTFWLVLVEGFILDLVILDLPREEKTSKFKKTRQSKNKKSERLSGLESLF